jgi:hypothetical protein
MNGQFIWSERARVLFMPQNFLAIGYGDSRKVNYDLSDVREFGRMWREEGFVFGVGFDELKQGDEYRCAEVVIPSRAIDSVWSMYFDGKRDEADHLVIQMYDFVERKTLRAFGD